MKHGSLFSGIGGFDLAAEWMGWQNVFHCEWNPFCQKILKHYWPHSIQYHDITKTDFTIHRGDIDILTGGFPCQPYSSAGKRRGKEDDRHLWPEMLRAIREIQPSWIVGENVRGLTNWNGGMVFDEVQADLEAEGYEVTPFLLPACAVNAPHRRDRIWFVAHSTCSIQRGNKFRSLQSKNGKVKKQRTQAFYNAIRPNGIKENATNTKGSGLESEMAIGKLERDKRFEFCDKWNQWHSFPSVSPLCNGNDGISDRLDAITFSKWRKESIKAGGNAVVPQVVYQIFKTIQQFQNLNQKP